MRKNLAKLALSAVLLLPCSTAALADGNAFTPLNFDDTAYSVPSSTSKASTTTKSGAVEQSTVELQSTGNVDIQTAISKLDTALEEIKKEQILYKSKYADVDNQYKLIKNERNMLKKQVCSIDKRIKSLDRAKEKIRANVL